MALTRYPETYSTQIGLYSHPMAHRNILSMANTRIILSLSYSDDNDNFIFVIRMTLIWIHTMFFSLFAGNPDRTINTISNSLDKDTTVIFLCSCSLISITGWTIMDFYALKIYHVLSNYHIILL